MGKWTNDGIVSKPLGEWAGELDLHSAPAEKLFNFEATRIVRRGGDIQDYKVILYVADQKCTDCGRFMQRETRHPEKSKLQMSPRCIGCMSGGVISAKLFR